MEVEISEIRNLFEEEETGTLGAPHPGISVFQQTNALQYFNEEQIIKGELKEDNVNLYLEKKNICFTIEKIFDIQMSLMHQCTKSNDNPEDIDKIPGRSHQLTSTGEANNYLSKHAQLIERFRLDLTLPELDCDSSVCVSLSSSTTGTPSKVQEEPIASVICEGEAVSTPLDDTYNFSANLVSLFHLMSVLPEPAATKCKQVLDKDRFAWKVTLYDIILVLLNWGTTLQSLGLEDINLPTRLFSPQLSSPNTNNKNSFPAPSNVVLVLHSICQRLPHPSSPQMSCGHRALLVKVMMYAALDHNHRRYLAQYCRTIRTVLDTFPSWGEEEATVVVNLLHLDRLQLQNSVFVCCSLFNMTYSSLSLVGLLASHKVLHHQFGLPAEASFSTTIKHLLRPPELLKKFKLWHVYIITSHIHSLLVRNACQTPPCFKEVVAALQQWTVEVRSALTQYPYTYTLSSSHVRERLSRLTAECAIITRSLN